MKLAEYLAIHNLTQAEFAQEIGTSAPTVSRWAGGQRKPRLIQLVKISEATKRQVTANDFADQLESTDA